MQELAFGSLYDFLHVKKLRPDPGTLLRVGIDIASAMDYCHSLATPVIHRDVNAGTIAYMAPELFSAGYVDESTRK